MLVPCPLLVRVAIKLVAPSTISKGIFLSMHDQLSSASHLLTSYLCSSSSYKKYYKIDPVAVHFSKTGVQSDLPKSILEYKGLIEKFDRATADLEAHRVISTESLVAANFTFTENSTGVRASDCWVGEKGSKTEYKCPTQPDLDIYLKELIHFINTCDLCIDNILYIYFKLIAIHPFLDGNGRTSRALFYRLIQSEFDLFFCPSLYHTKENHRPYFNLVKLAALGREHLVGSEYLKKIKRDAKITISSVKKSQNRIDKKLKSILFNKPSLLYLANSIYKKLYKNPFLNINEVDGIDFDNPALVKDLNDMISKGAVKVQRSKNGAIYIYSDLVNKFLREFHLLMLHRK